MGRLRSLATPARPLRLGGIPSQSPSEGGCRGTECCPFFCSICRPQSGRVGNETMPFFCSFFNQKQSRNSDLASKNSHSSYFFHQKRAGVATRQIWRMMTPPQNALNLIKTGPLPQLTRFGE